MVWSVGTSIREIRPRIVGGDNAGGGNNRPERLDAADIVVCHGVAVRAIADDEVAVVAHVDAVVVPGDVVVFDAGAATDDPNEAGFVAAAVVSIRVVVGDQT